MIAEDQNEAVEFLSNADSYGLSDPMETIETHISRIFLVGDRAFKMKRAVKLPYVDFSNAALRLDACEKEIRFMRRPHPASISGSGGSRAVQMDNWASANTAVWLMPSWKWSASTNRCSPTGWQRPADCRRN
jgi:hypothetical protein